MNIYFNGTQLAATATISVYAQLRTLLNVTGIATVTNRVKLTYGAIVSYFAGDSDGNVTIDISDIVRSAPTGSVTIVETVNGSETGTAYAITWNVAGLIPAGRMIIPRLAAREEIADALGVPATIIPPRTIYESVIAPSRLELTNDADLLLFINDEQKAHTNFVQANLSAGDTVRVGVLGTDTQFDTAAVEMTRPTVSFGITLTATYPNIRMQAPDGGTYAASQMVRLKYGTKTALFNDEGEVVFDFVGNGHAGYEDNGLEIGYTYGDGNTLLAHFVANDQRDEFFELGKRYRFVATLEKDGESHIVDLIDCTIYEYAAENSATVRETVCEKRYAAVEWIGATGAKKRATFELTKHTPQQGESYDILRSDNAYDIRRGWIDAATLRLDGLSAYDMWYHADIITSSDVRVALNSGDYNGASDEIYPRCKVEVTTKKITIPDGSAAKYNTLEIDVNLRRYDAV